MENLYQQFIKIAVNQNKKIEKQLNQPLQNFDKIYNNIEIPFKEDRLLHIRWVKLPTFIINNKPYYYAIYFNDISFWRKGEIKELYKQCLESIDRYDVDSHTIFQSGQLFGYFNPIENINMKFYNIFILNSPVFTDKHKLLVYQTICSILENRCKKWQSDGKIFGSVEKDIKRIRNLVEAFSIYTYNIISNVRSTSKVSYNILEVKEGN